jgi:hypothetical protein
MYIATDIESRLGRLVIGYILRGNANSVYRIVQEGVQAIVRGDSSHIKAQGAVVLCTHEYLFAPIAQDVGVNTGIRLGTIIADTAVKLSKHTT